MIDETTHQGEQPTPERVVQMGEWFSPFQNYEALPYRKNTEDYRSKDASPHILSGIGEISVGLAWVGNQANLNTYEKGDSDAVLIALPFDTGIIKESDMLEESKKIEARLMFLEIAIQTEKNVRGYVRLPDGTEVALKSEIEGYVDEDGNQSWFGGEIKGGRRDGEIVDTIAIPEIASVIEKIQIKFVPKEVKVKV